jgi:hypothetical protein
MRSSSTSFVCLVAYIGLAGCGGAVTDSVAVPDSPDVEEPGAEENHSGTDIYHASAPTAPTSTTGADNGDSSTRQSVKGLKVSLAVGVRSNEAINPKQSFHSGTRRIYAGFQVVGFDSCSTIRVLWYRDDELFREDDIECEGEKRYAVSLEKPKKLATGDYSVEVEVDGEMFARRTFYVGGDNVSPVLAHVALGGTKGKNRIPRPAKKVFKTNVKAIRCGVRFLDLPENAKIQVQWVMFEGSGEDEKLVHTSDTIFEKGGTGNVIVDWEPEEDLLLGSYKAVIFLGKRKMREVGFTVE